MSEKLIDRLQRDRDHSVDRRRVSEHSQRYMAEAIRDGETDAALRAMFELLTGDVVTDHPTIRPVEGEIALGADATLAENRSVVLDVSLAGASEAAYISPSYGGAYRFDDLAPGEYSLSASVVEVREYDQETLDVTTYEVADATLDYEAAITVDADRTPIGDAVVGPTVTVASLTIDEQSGGA
jgi:hypothetical protein